MEQRLCQICRDFLSKDRSKNWRINIYQDELPRPLYKIFRAARNEVTKWSICHICAEEIKELGFKVISEAEIVQKKSKQNSIQEVIDEATVVELKKIK